MAQNNSNTNIILTNYNMSSTTQRIKAILDADIQANGRQWYHPKQLIKGGTPTKKAIKYSQRLVREGRTTELLQDPQNPKIYNADTGSFINLPRDRRYKDKRIKQTFLNQHNIVNDTFASKKDNQVFTFTAGDQDVIANTWSSDLEGTLESNNLLRYLIKQNNLYGRYRIIIIRDGEIIVELATNIQDLTTWWKDNYIVFQQDSAFMKWNFDLATGEVVKFIFSKEFKLNRSYYAQTFADGVLSRCLLDPIVNWAKNSILFSKSKPTKYRYITLLNKLVGKKTKKGYLDKYDKGVPEQDIPALCEDLQIGMDIEQPFNSNLLLEYRSMKKPLKVFKFINTRLNHVDMSNGNSFNEKTLFKIGDPIEVETRKELRKILEEYYKQGINPILRKDSYGIKAIQTLDKYYKLTNEYQDHVNEWEDDQGLNYCSLEGLSNKYLQSFINDGTHFNGTVDFEPTIIFKNKNRYPKTLRHIDMTKAYTQFKSTKFYEGFMLKITDFRETNKEYDNGLYYITNIDFSNCHNKFIYLNNKLGWFMDGNIYSKAELTALKAYGARYEIKAGAWGIMDDFEFDDKMINGKQKMIFENREISIPYYSLWAGMNCMLKETKNFYMKGEKEYFENINTEADIYYSEGEARIAYPSKYQFNKKHITAQITAYQRLHMLEQLMNMDLKKVIRICCDGIYYHEHDFKLNKTFSHKDKVTFNNDPAQTYLSNLYEMGKDYDWQYHLAENEVYDGIVQEYREHYKTELYDGAGGDGKTFKNLFIDKGFINICYAPHSNKLQSRMKGEYEKILNKKLRCTNHSRLLQEPFSTVEGECYKYNVYIIDECSMLTEKQKEYLISNIKGKIIFCGDLSCQCLPIDKGQQMTDKYIDNIAKPSPQNYRFKNQAQKDNCNYLRDCIINNKKVDMKKLTYKNVDKQFVKDHYKKEDIILVSRHIYNDEWTKTFKKIEKYKVTNNTRDYSNGDIIFNKVKKVNTELRHGYTIHSVQGETFKNNIYIDMRKMIDLRMFYTAVSRAEYDNQIYLIS